MKTNVYKIQFATINDEVIEKEFWVKELPHLELDDDLYYVFTELTTKDEIRVCYSAVRLDSIAVHEATILKESEVN